MDEVNELDKYLALVEERKAARPTIELPMPSGAVWRLFPVNIQQLGAAGRLPTQLFRHGKQVDVKTLSMEKQVEIGLQILETTRDVMLNNLVFPKITMDRQPGTICIEDAAEKIDPEDFEYFTKWVMNGGQSQQNSFRKPTGKKRK